MSFRDSLTQPQRWRPTLRDSVVPTRARLASGCAVSLSRTEFGSPYPQGHFRRVSVSMLSHLHFPFPQAFFPGATAIPILGSLLQKSCGRHGGRPSMAENTHEGRAPSRPLRGDFCKRLWGIHLTGAAPPACGCREDEDSPPASLEALSHGEAPRREGMSGNARIRLPCARKPGVARIWTGLAGESSSSIAEDEGRDECRGY
jgi:hypothetical protein